MGGISTTRPSLATVHVAARVVEDYGADLLVEFINPNGSVRVCVGRDQLALDYLPSPASSVAEFSPRRTSARSHDLARLRIARAD